MIRSCYLVSVLILATLLVQMSSAETGWKRILGPGSMAKRAVIVADPLPAGTYTVGTGGYFPTLDSAYRRLMGGGILDAVTLMLTDPLYIAPPGADSGAFFLAGPIAGADSAHRITIRPANATGVIIRGSGSAVLWFHNVSYLTLDGIALDGPTRLNVVASTNIAHPWNDCVDFAGNSDHNEVLNIHASSDDLLRESAGVGIMADIGSPDHCLVSGVKVSSAMYGIYLGSSATGNYRPQGTILRNNQIGVPTDSLMAVGIQTVEADGSIIEGNHIQNLRGTMSGPSRYYQIGINAYNSKNVVIRNNIIHNFAASYANTAIEGILCSGDQGLKGSTNWIYNNVVYDLKNRAGSGNTSAIAGIRVWQNDAISLLHNSVCLSSTDDIAPGQGSAAIWIDASATSPWILNNNLVNLRNRSGEVPVVLRVDVAGMISDNNNLYITPGPGKNIGLSGSTFFPTLANWRTLGGDQRSVNVLPVFRDEFLRIDSTAASAKALNNGGSSIVGIATDKDGRIRNTGAPDIGAYEFDLFITTLIGMRWARDPLNPVLSGGGPSAWNTHVFNPSVLYNADSNRFEMWFNGVAGPNGSYPRKVGRATSKDGSTWVQDPAPVLSPTAGTWDAYTVEAPRVIRENGSYKMWYTSFASPTSVAHIGYATSPDGITWTKYSGNPTFGPAGAPWEATGPGSCSVMPVQGGGYKIWYDGYDASAKNSKIGYAISADGITWQRDSLLNPVLRAGGSGNWDESNVAFPIVLRLPLEDPRDSAYFMWYVGSQLNGPYKGGVAVSSDGVSGWTKSGLNPILAGLGSGWDGTNAGAVSVLILRDTLHMWYDGSLTPSEVNYFRIGHAMTPRIVGDVTERLSGIPDNFVLEHNYPNPFNPTTTIQFSITHSASTELTIYDLLGREVATLVNEMMTPGTYKVKWDANAVASGIYFYRLRSGEFSETKRMLLLK